MEEAMKEEKEEKMGMENKPLGDGRLKVKSTTSAFGISLYIVVKGEIFWKDGPCSVSHVIWEQISDL